MVISCRIRTLAGMIAISSALAVAFFLQVGYIVYVSIALLNQSAGNHFHHVGGQRLLPEMGRALHDRAVLHTSNILFTMLFLSAKALSFVDGIFLSMAQKSHRLGVTRLILFIDPEEIIRSKATMSLDHNEHSRFRSGGAARLRPCSIPACPPCCSAMPVLSGG